jgi:hypothetical protein
MPEARKHLTIIWDDERKEILERLDKLESYEAQAKVSILERLDALELAVQVLIDPLRRDREGEALKREELSVSE